MDSKITAKRRQKIESMMVIQQERVIGSQVISAEVLLCSVANATDFKEDFTSGTGAGTITLLSDCCGLSILILKKMEAF